MHADDRNGPPLFVKREDLSSPHYGGNKVRTLEAHLGRALCQGAEEIWATGAYGSNHATASVVHAQRLGLRAGIMLWPQPATQTAVANLGAMLSLRPLVSPLLSVVTLPAGMARLPARSMKPVYLMSPGGANLVGALAHVSAGLELAEQVRAGELPSPDRIVLAVGSTCTISGLMVGLHLAAKLGIAFREKVPIVHGVRVTPWPVTSRVRVAHFAKATSTHLARLVNQPDLTLSLRKMHRGLRIDRHYLGGGYGRPTSVGWAAEASMKSAGGPALDAVYSAKSAAAFFALAKIARGPLLFWATKSSAPLPEPGVRELRLAPKRWQSWLRSVPVI